MEESGITTQPQAPTAPALPCRLLSPTLPTALLWEAFLWVILSLRSHETLTTFPPNMSSPLKAALRLFISPTTG